jgi:hypothetical protein
MERLETAENHLIIQQCALKNTSGNIQKANGSTGKMKKEVDATSFLLQQKDALLHWAHKTKHESHPFPFGFLQKGWER